VSAVAEAALPFVAWSRVFSPLAPAAWREEAWRVLGLPGRFADCETEFVSAFVAGLPAPTAPLLLHATLGRDGGAVREDWMRVIGHLGMRWKDHRLPPDHLGVACDVLVEAIGHGETVLVAELRERYLDPWCVAAGAKLGDAPPAIAAIPPAFAGDLASA